jgi:hypothetical protein
MTEPVRLRVYRWLLNTGAICFAAVVLMLITNDREGRTFYPVWLLWCTGAACVIGFVAAYVLRPLPPPAPEPREATEAASEPIEASWTWVEWSKAADVNHAWIAKLCRRHKIKLELSVMGQNGHMSSPEEWTFSAPIPLTAADLAELATHHTLNVTTTWTDVGGVVATGFSYGQGWTLYSVSGKQATR